MLLGAVAVTAMLAFAAPASADEFLRSPGFEGGDVVEAEIGGELSSGIDNPDWLEADDKFATPICATSICPPNFENGPRSGSNWTLFGLYGGKEVHRESVAQSFTLPPVAGTPVISLYIWVGKFEREAAVRVELDGQEVFRLEDQDSAPFTAGYKPVSIPVASVQPGTHTLRIGYISDATDKEADLTTISVDDVSFSATPPPPPSPPPVIPPPDTQITKVQLYSAKAGKTGSAKSPRRPALFKATRGKTGKAAKAKFTFTGSGGSGALTFECKLDRGEFKPCKSPAFYKTLKLGTHRFEVRAVDAAGNPDPTPAVREFKAEQGTSGKTK